MAVILLSDYEKKLQISRRTRDSNCIGTALFLGGVRDSDEFVDLSRAWHELKSMEVLDAPIPGSIAVWKEPDKEKCYHMAFVIGADKGVVVTHRDGFGGQLVEGTQIEKVKKAYDLMKGFEFNYYLPRVFDNSLGLLQHPQPL